MKWLPKILSAVASVVTRTRRAAQVWSERRRTVVRDHGQRWRERER